MANVLWCTFCGHLTALDAALEFQQQQVVPNTWKTEVKEESSSSEEDDEDEEEEQEEDASGEEEEVAVWAVHLLLSLQPQSKKNPSNCLVSCLQEEVEPFPEERENFLQQLYKFMEDRGESTPWWARYGHILFLSNSYAGGSGLLSRPDTKK